jgi:hypothetical protein
LLSFERCFTLCGLRGFACLLLGSDTGGLCGSLLSQDALPFSLEFLLLTTPTTRQMSLMMIPNGRRSYITFA